MAWEPVGGHVHHDVLLWWSSRGIGRGIGGGGVVNHTPLRVGQAGQRLVHPLQLVDVQPPDGQEQDIDDDAAYIVHIYYIYMNKYITEVHLCFAVSDGVFVFRS